MLYRHIFLIVLAIFNLSLMADQTQQLYIGPEIYHVHKTKSPGSKQNGVIYGVRGGYDRIKNNAFYLGAEGLYASGTLDGKTGEGDKLKSNFADRMIEGRLGYTLGFNCRCYPIQLSPFVGVGHFEEENNYKKPTRFHIHTTTKFDYVTGGFLSNVTLTDCWTFGVNFKLRYMWDPKFKVKHDPEYDEFTLLIKNRYHYRTELPITYHTSLLCRKIWISLVPFFEYRGYGEHANFPYDYGDTKLQLYGATLKMMYCF